MMRRHLVLIAGALVTLPTWVGARTVEKERADVPTAEAVTVGTVRYEAPLWTRARGLPQNGGYLEAFDTRTNQSLWLIQVYAISPNSDRETDKQEIFITRMTPDHAGQHLIVEDERGRHWLVDLASRRITRLTTDSMQETGKAMEESAKRRAPRVDPVVGNGIRYEVLRGARSRGFKQNGGVVAAIDVASGKELWTLLVYTTVYDEKEEADVQDVFITELKLSSDGQSLHVKNDARKQFVVTLSDRSIAEKQ